MKLWKQLRQFGCIRQETKQRKPQHIKEVSAKNQIKDVCLNCTKENCESGYCKEFRK